MGIIRPIKRKKDPYISKNAIMIMPSRELKYIVSKLNAKDMGEIDNCLYRLYLGPNDIAVCGPFLGAPQAVIGLERLIVLGAKNIWVFSWCGSINEKVKVGDVIIPTQAFSEEGTSQHYPISSPPYSNSYMNRLIKNKLKEKKMNFVEGLIWTTDAPYRETRDKIINYKIKGAIGVDMEISALMTVAIFRSISLAGVFVVSDELFDMKWNPGFSNPILKETSQKILDILIELALSYEEVLHYGQGYR